MSSESDIVQFLCRMREQGQIPASTASAQKAAVVKVLSVLDDNECNELTENTNVENLIQRFENKAKHDLNEDSLRTYGSRFKSAFYGFLKWNKDPSNYKPKSRKGRPQKTSDQQKNIAKNNEQKQHVHNTTSVINAHSLIKYPLPTGEIRGSLEIPEKLSKQTVNTLTSLVTEILKAHEIQENNSDENI